MQVNKGSIAVVSSLLLTIALTACEPSDKNAVGIAPPMTSQLPSIPAETAKPTVVTVPSTSPCPVSSPTPKTDIPSPKPTVLPSKHHNEGIMSRKDRDKLSDQQQMLINYLDDFVYDFNHRLNADKYRLDPYQYPFGTDYIVLKNAEMPKFNLESNYASVLADVEIKKKLSDNDPILTRKDHFYFMYNENGSGKWRLAWWE